MLSLFRNKLFENLIWVIVFALAIQSIAIVFYDFSSLKIPASSPLISGWIDDLHSSKMGLYVSVAITFIISISIGFGFNTVVNNNEVLFRQSFFPALFFFYLTHLFSSQNLITPELLASAFCLLLIHKFLSLDPRNIKTTPFLDMGFFAATAFCILPETIWFIPALLIALIVAGYLTFKNFLLLLTGIALPIYFLAIIFYLVDGNLNNYFQFFSFNLIVFDIDRFSSLSWYDLFLLGFIGFVLLLSFSDLLSNFSKNTIRTRRSIQLLLLFLASNIAAIIFSSAPLYQSFTLLALPLSVFLSYYFLKTKKAFWRETLFSLFFIILIIAKIAMSM